MKRQLLLAGALSLFSLAMFALAYLTGTQPVEVTTAQIALK